MRDVDPFSSSGKLVRDVEPFSRKRNREMESVQFSQIEKGKNSVRTEKTFMNSLKSKLIGLFFLKKKREFAAQTRLSEAQAGLDRREWERRDAGVALYETGGQLESQRMELYQANHLSDQAQREKSWRCEELDLRNKIFQKDRAKYFQEIEELRTFFVWKLGARQIKLDKLNETEKRILL